MLDPADSSLDFVHRRENARPIAIYRIDGEFLLCYDGEWRVRLCDNFIVADKAFVLFSIGAEFAFYVNKNGWRAKSNWIIQWEGYPTTFGKD